MVIKKSKDLSKKKNGNMRQDLEFFKGSSWVNKAGPDFVLLIIIKVIPTKTK